MRTAGAPRRAYRAAPQAHGPPPAALQLRLLSLSQRDQCTVHRLVVWRHDSDSGSDRGRERRAVSGTVGGTQSGAGGDRCGSGGSSSNDGGGGDRSSGNSGGAGADGGSNVISKLPPGPWLPGYAPAPLPPSSLPPLQDVSQADQVRALL
eukprot:357510-Chlamydomonas_euryale.AAC.1